jgi:Gpi18-like mannosyltransferase
MVCFILLGNEEIREFNAYLFNDTFLALYILVCIYLISMNRPFLAALFLTMSCSIKAGAMLMLPSFLGWV